MAFSSRGPGRAKSILEATRRASSKIFQKNLEYFAYGKKNDILVYIQIVDSQPLTKLIKYTVLTRRIYGNQKKPPKGQESHSNHDY